MAFPTTGILDSFTRADEGPPPSASWDYPINSSFSSGSGMSVLSNVIGSSDATFCGSYWKTSYGPNSEVFVTLSTLPSSGVDVFVDVRIVSPGSGGSGGTSGDSYSTSWVNQAGSDQLIYYRVDNAVYTQLGSTETPGNMTAGDKFGVEMIGSTIQAYRYTGGTWAAFGTSRSDSTYSAAGSIGCGVGDNTGRLDDFGGGTVVPANRTVTPGVKTLTLSPLTPTVTASNHQLVTPGPAALTLARFVPVVSASNNQLVTPGPATLAIARFIPTVSTTAHQTVTPGVRTLTLTTFAPTVTASGGQSVTPGPASLTLTAFIPAVSSTDHKVATPGPASLTLTAFIPTVSVASGSVLVVVGAATLTISRYTPDVTVSGAQGDSVWYTRARRRR